VDDYKIVVEKSTVPVCTSEWVRRVMVMNGAPEHLFEVASNPEFLREGSAVADFLYPDRIVIGANSKRAAETLASLYEPLTSGRYYQRVNVPAPDNARTPVQLIVTSARSAELIKHASNAFLAMKISFINAVANICESVGANVEQVCEGIGTDSRIGPKFMSPGIGYGGSCFPKDLKAFRAVAKSNGYHFDLLSEVIRINDDQCQRFLRKVRSALWTLKGKRIAVVGLAFKGGTDDIRESPAITMIKLLLKEGCEVVAYDPAMSWSDKRARFHAALDEPGTISARRLAFTAQLAAEAAGAAGDVDECIAFLLRASACGLFDRHWLDRCPLLQPVRDEVRFAIIRADVAERADAIHDALFGDHRDEATVVTAVG
jgi:UDPglucose 6-dehydrogenase